MNGALLRWGVGRRRSWLSDDVSPASVYVYVHVWEIPAAVFFHSNLPEIAIRKFMS
jgi:hypothetical protein